MQLHTWRPEFEVRCVTRLLSTTFCETVTVTEPGFTCSGSLVSCERPSSISATTTPGLPGLQTPTSLCTYSSPHSRTVSTLPTEPSLSLQSNVSLTLGFMRNDEREDLGLP